jgi:hypothetical protein
VSSAPARAHLGDGLICFPTIVPSLHLLKGSLAQAPGFCSENVNAPFKPYIIDSGVTDELRRALDVPSLSETKMREAEMNSNK